MGYIGALFRERRIITDRLFNTLHDMFSLKPLLHGIQSDYCLLNNKTGYASLCLLMVHNLQKKK